MDLKQLRLGNYVYRGDKSIVDIGPSHIKYLSEGRIIDYSFIPLNEECLIRFGFKYKRPGTGGQDQWAGYGVWSLGDIHFLGLKDGKILYYNRLRKSQVAYIHQLQNIYYDLTGDTLLLEGDKPIDPIIADAFRLTTVLTGKSCSYALEVIDCARNLIEKISEEKVIPPLSEDIN